MKRTVLALVLALSGAVFAAADVSGIWTGGGFYIILKQEGSKLSGSGGPDKNEQYPFTGGNVDGDRLTFKVGKFELDLRMNAAGNEIRGEMRSGDQTMPVLVKRLDTSAPPPAPTAFEVASIKPNTSGERGASSHTRGGVLTLRNYPLKQMIENAYDVRDYSLSGPDWLDTLRFDVEAKPPSQASREQMEWSQEDNGPNAPDAPGLPGPTIFTALQEQLRLRLQAQKVQVEIVVVDHIEKLPTEN